MMNPNTILQEITPLGEHDLLYVADRHKACCDFPLHRHTLCELNFVEHGAGCERIVGDSVEEIGDYELVLISSPNLEHAWAQGHCQSHDIHEITIQFRSGFGVDSFLSTNPFQSIQKMFERAQRGLCFPMAAIMSVYSRLQRLSSIRDGFEAAIEMAFILHELSKYDDARELSSTSFAQVRTTSESRRVAKVKEYVSAHYMEDIRLEQLSAMIGMVPTAFSRFFKLRTGKTLSDFIVDVRLGAASRKLVDTDDPVSSICYDCGFNTLSNFNRLFRARKGCSPTEFREKYVKTKVIV
ncbi:MAG: helix-turn-helix domain-containing protein [Paludibacteraceae bacterium]|nr:helix-turn-helix domain-containing protein [Paludibacteraceae bacterium]